jgi:allantoin racemase
MKRILIINPNSSAEMTRTIQDFAKMFVGNRAEVVTALTVGAPEFIETYADESQAMAGMMRLIKNNQESYDGFVIACHSDPNLDLMKELSLKPVVGIGETSMRSACLIGDRFTVLSATLGSIPNKKALVSKYNLLDQLSSVRALGHLCAKQTQLDLCEKVSRDAIEQDSAEVIVLGCADMAGMSFELQDRLGIPVVDGIASSLSILLGLIDQGLSISKISRYRSHA